MNLENLNPQQLQAVCHSEGPLMVVAGAGSGKTRVITCRIAHLIQEKGLSPESILAITFTNKAAGEMKERVRNILDLRGAHPWVSTFHSFCLRILRKLGATLPKFLKRIPQINSLSTFFNRLPFASDALMTPEISSTACWRTVNR